MAIFRKGNPLRTLKGQQYSNFGSGGESGEVLKYFFNPENELVDATIIDSQDLNASILDIGNGYFFIAYTGTDSDGYVSVVKFSNNTLELIDTLEHDTTQGLQNKLILVDSTHFALSYKGASGYIYLKIFTINSSYNITQTSSLTVYNSTAYGVDLCLVDSTHILVTYGNASKILYGVVCVIDGSYNTSIVGTPTQIATGATTASSTAPSIAQIDSTHYAVAYLGASSDAYIASLLVNGSYAVSVIYTHQHTIGTITKGNNALLLLSTTTLLLGFDDGIRLFTIDGSYNISTTSYLSSLPAGNSALAIGYNVYSGQMIKIASGYYLWNYCVDSPINSYFALIKLDGTTLSFQSFIAYNGIYSQGVGKLSDNKFVFLSGGKYRIITIY